MTFLPNTAGCFTADEALRTLRLAREAGDWKLVKLEVLADQKTLYPDMEETLAAAKVLVAEGFEVMVYCSDDPVYARKLGVDLDDLLMVLGNFGRTCPPPPSEPIAWWRMEDRNGGVIPDSSGNGHDLSIEGSPSFDCSSAFLDGNGYFTTPDTEHLDLLAGEVRRLVDDDEVVVVRVWHAWAPR